MRDSARGRLRSQARIVGIADGQEQRSELRSGAAPIRRPGRAEQRRWVGVAGCAAEPSRLAGMRDSSSLGWIVRIYLPRWLTRWNMEGTLRCVQPSDPREEIPVLRQQRCKTWVR